jgi:EmrB/QacA subfamily drug resistance transporter
MTRGNWLRLGVIGLGTLIGPLDSAVNIAFPDITRAFGIPLQSIQWVVICYVLTYASLMLVFGRLGDQYGHQRIFMGGLAVSSVAFVLCASATQYEWLLVARIFQGVGTAMVISCGPALATGLFDENFRSRALGAYTMIFALGGVLGPSLGGLIVEAWGWPAVFWFRLTIALTALPLAFMLRLPPQRKADGSFDLAGAVLLAGALGLLLLTFSRIRDPDMRPETIVLLVGVTLAAFAGFVWQERRVDAPLIALGVFRDLNFTLFNLTNVAVNLTGFSVLLLVPYYLTRATGLPLSLGGAVLASGPLGMIVAAQLAGRLAHRAGAGRIAFVGALFVASGITAIGFWGADESPVWMVGTLIVQGVGLGLFQVACLERVSATLPRANRGVAGSLVMVTRTVGVVLAASLLTMIFTVLETRAAGAPDAFLTAFQTTFRYTGLFMAAFLALTCLRPRMWFK